MSDFNYPGAGMQRTQQEPLPGRTDMVKNNAGGYTFKVTPWHMLRRFLILGTEGGSYYCTARKMTVDNTDNVLHCIMEDGKRVVGEALTVSDQGIAPKNDPAIYVLALCMALGDAETKKAAAEAMPMICRTVDHFTKFVVFSKQMRGWGRSLRRVVANWYTGKTPEQLVYQAIKYPQRNGYTHRDLLRQAHPKTDSGIMNELFGYLACKPEERPEFKITQDPLKVFEVVRGLDPKDPKAAVKAINDYNLPREVLPTELLNDITVWDALLMSGKGMPMTAMIRNLAKMTAIGLIAPGTAAMRHVVATLNNEEHLQKARIHPINVLAALKIYQQGKGDKGSLTWTPVVQVVDALDDAFYKSFKYVEPSGKRFSMNCDVSGSMSSMPAIGLDIFTAREVTAAMMMALARVEKDYAVNGFTTRLMPLTISPRQRLDDVIKTISGLPYGGTDCAMPMVEALKNKQEYDVFAVYTDNETWAGRTHPCKALEEYRQKMGIDAKLVVCAVSSTGFTIADPQDPGMLDVVGFDSSAPGIISEFAKGNL